MVPVETFVEMAMSFPGTISSPHFDRIAFKTKKIFAILHEPSRSVNLMLSLEDQAVFCSIDPSVIYPVPNKWGLHGATTIELSLVDTILLNDALTCAYINGAPAKLAAPYIRLRDSQADS